MAAREGNKKYYWLKLRRDFFKRHDIRIIEEMPNGKDYILFYLKLLLESIDHNGELRFNETIPYNEQMLSVITNTNIDIVRSAMKVFVQLKMIEVLDDETIYMTEVAKLVGSETIWAEKKRLYREKDKVRTLSAPCPTDVRQEIEKEIEIETEQDTELEKESVGGAAAPAPAQRKQRPARRKYGQYGWVQLTEEQYACLLADLGPEELSRCIKYIDESAQSNGNKNKWRDWNLVIRRCSREGWGLNRRQGAAAAQKVDTLGVLRQMGGGRPMTGAQAAKLVGLMAVAYPSYDKFRDESHLRATVALWGQMFAEDDFSLVQLALEKHIATSKWPPSIADIRDILADITMPGLLPVDEAWRAVQQLMRLHDRLYEPTDRYLPAPIAQAVDTVGYDVLVALSRAAVCGKNDKAGLDRVAFEQAYGAVRDRERERAALPGDLRRRLAEARQRHADGSGDKLDLLEAAHRAQDGGVRWIVKSDRPIEIIE